MKNLFLTLFSLLFSSIIFACDCEYGGNFLKASASSETIVKARIIEHIYHTKNGKRFTDYEEYFAETMENEFDDFYDTGESIKIEVLELIRGTETRKTIEIFNTDGADCRAEISGFEKDKIYIISIYQPKRKYSKLPNETDSDYAIGACSENWLEYLIDKNEVRGYITGKKRRIKKTYSYEKLVKKITLHNNVYKK
ncbi:hypothetical protein CW736_11525 [Nonlabens sp. MB-3u-79]|jgi:hypothetical protein|uniref:hypothetical protein n=1 Tax=Nonlabens sp. MB-3u-79 TaxID=2058134 RepID=UPI000C313184|nr:hypothetical protein [Nonlabens sp. MB-3u-79]AUC79953.1 hypothetical protein CW736_11525 [Nonlabens sp. MB-3u-79]